MSAAGRAARRGGKGAAKPRGGGRSAKRPSTGTRVAPSMTPEEYLAAAEQELELRVIATEKVMGSLRPHALALEVRGTVAALGDQLRYRRGHVAHQ
jgi:hypothetical protein